MPQSAVDQTLSMHAKAIDAVDLTKRAVLQASRSWVEAAEHALGVPSHRSDPWGLVDMSFDSAHVYVDVQTAFAKSLLEATAKMVGASATTADRDAPIVAAAPAAAPKSVVSQTPVAPAKIVSDAPRAPKPAKRAASRKSPSPTTPPKPKGTSPNSPAEGPPQEPRQPGGHR